MRTVWCFVATLTVGIWFATITLAYEHEDSLVEFVEYEEDVITDARHINKPYFLLFSAQWCHWCHEFAQHTLTRKDVANYLNDNFTSVFIDVDIYNAAYVKYRATGLPYTVFLNPDGSIYYKYSGTLYGDDFLDVITQVAKDVGVGKSAFGTEYARVNYVPPDALAKSELIDLPDTFRKGVTENFDPEEYGLGKGQKAVLPRTFLYLLEPASASNKKDVIESIGQCLERAIDTIYDPVEGGFFRYAEKRDWQIPHYEKFADLNAAAVLLLYRMNKVWPSSKLEQAADKTTDYLATTLFDAKAGAFLSFQVADTSYYFLSEERRTDVDKPKVMDKIFGDRLAATLSYLIEVVDHAMNPDLHNKILQSLDFLGEMIMQAEGINRYYLASKQKWLGQGGLSDHAYFAILFTRAAARFQNPQYKSVATKVMREALANFHNEEQGIFLDPTVDTASSAEYLMEMNGLLALTLMELDDALEQNEKQLVESVIKYFSLMGEILEDRFWDGIDWEFTETYVPYLSATERYFSPEVVSESN